MMHEKPVQGVQTTTRTHPAGRAGAKISLNEAAERAWKARMSPRLRAWVTRVMAEANVSNGGRRQKAQAILDAFRKKVPYVADPLLGEFMATPEQTLCLDEGGLCFIGGDCDDQSIALAAAFMSIGIPAMIVGSSHREPAETPTHVYAAFEDELGEWVRVDGTTKYPVGKAAPFIKEWWIEPGEIAKDKGTGDFVGMAGPPEDESFGLAEAPFSAHDFRYPGIR